MLATLALASNSRAADPAHLALGVEVRGDQVEVRVRNTSPYPIQVPDFFVDAGKDTGYWIYLYDHSTKRLMHPSAMYQTPPITDGEPSQTPSLVPGQERKFSLPLSELLKFFSASSRCNWLIVVYAKNEHAVRVRSFPSVPVFVCQ